MSEQQDIPGKEKRIKRGYIWLGVGALIFAVMFYFHSFYPLSRIGPRQPIAFSHRVHAGVKEIDCHFCHSFVERSQDAGMPEMKKCFFCHDHVIPAHPEIQKEKKFLDAGKPVPWKRVFWVPDFVYFHHRPHVSWAGLECSKCHGDVRSMDRLTRVEFQMGFCVTCHKRNKAEIDCWLACHR